LQTVFQLHVITASSLFALGHFSGAIGRVTWGLLSDRIFGGERKKVYRFIALISGVFFLALSHLTPGTPFWVVILVITILGFTTVGSQGVGQSLIVEVAGKEFAGTASGFTQSFCFLGIVLMAPLFGFILDTFGRYFYAWASLALFSFIAFGLVSLVKEGFKKTL
jgi:ACS family hexuronate transporter-like MFS transporter